MDWLTFISQVVGAVAWPVALVALALVFRPKISTLLDRIREVSGPGGTSAKFGVTLEKAQEDLKELQPIDSDKPPAEPDPQDPFIELAEKSPSAAVIEAYKDVVRELDQLAVRCGLTRFTVRGGTADYLRMLSHAGVSNAEVELFRNIRILRNAAVHGPEKITTGEALEFKELSDRFIEAIRRKPAY